MEFSKKWLIVSGAATAMLTAIHAIGWVESDIVIAAFAEVGISSGFYFWKSKNENRSKYMMKYMEKWAKEYGPDAAIRAAEVVLKE